MTRAESLYVEAKAFDNLESNFLHIRNRFARKEASKGCKTAITRNDRIAMIRLAMLKAFVIASHLSFVNDRTRNDHGL